MTSTSITEYTSLEMKLRMMG